MHQSNQSLVDDGMRTPEEAIPQGVTVGPHEIVEERRKFLEESDPR
jgi:hypothetical protein